MKNTTDYKLSETSSFDTVSNRRGTNSVKWERDIPTDALPMWVADTDFRAPEAVIEALHQAVDHGIFGYSFFNKEGRDAIRNWLQKRHNYSIENDWILFHSGVVPSIATIIHALTNETDGIVVQPPVYPPFMNLVKLNNRTLYENPLHLNNGTYEMDFEGLENILAKGVKLFILCSPHNPVGRVWKREELEKLIALCKKYNTTIISDEIHHDLILFENKHIPTASLGYGENIITLFAPSKTFNVAGLKASVIVCENKEIREKIVHVQQCQGTGEVNKAGIVALQTAYEQGEQWLNEQIAYLEENVRYTKQYLQMHLPHIKWFQPEATYLLWLDCSYYEQKIGNVKAYLEKEGHIIVEDGLKYGTGGDGFIRLNIGTQKSLLQEGLQRITAALTKSEKEE
ncbi:MAG: MalY/PatB family protein [Bacillaceae bacterium]